MHYFCVHAALGRKQIPRDSAHKHAKVKKARSLSSACKCKTLANTLNRTTPWQLSRLRNDFLGVLYNILHVISFPKPMVAATG